MELTVKINIPDSQVKAFTSICILRTLKEAAEFIQSAENVKINGAEIDSDNYGEVLSNNLLSVAPQIESIRQSIVEAVHQKEMETITNQKSPPFSGITLKFSDERLMGLAMIAHKMCYDYPLPSGMLIGNVMIPLQELIPDPTSMPNLDVFKRAIRRHKGAIAFENEIPK